MHREKAYLMIFHSTEDQLFDTLIPTPIKEVNAADTRYGI